MSLATTTYPTLQDHDDLLAKFESMASNYRQRILDHRREYYSRHNLPIPTIDPRDSFESPANSIVFFEKPEPPITFCGVLARIMVFGMLFMKIYNMV